MYKKEPIWNYSPPYPLLTERAQSLLCPRVYHPERTGGGKRITLSPNARMSEWKSEEALHKESARLMTRGKRGQTALFIAKQLPVRYFCCNGRRKMKHFSGELIKGPYDKGVLCLGSSNCPLFLFSFSLSPSLSVCLFVSAMLPVWDIAKQWNMELKRSQQSTSC